MCAYISKQSDIYQNINRRNRFCFCIGDYHDRTTISWLTFGNISRNEITLITLINGNCDNSFDKCGDTTYSIFAFNCFGVTQRDRRLGNSRHVFLYFSSNSSLSRFATIAKFIICV